MAPSSCLPASPLPPTGSPPPCHQPQLAVVGGAPPPLLQLAVSHLLSATPLTASGGVGFPAPVTDTLGADVDMVQGETAGGEQLITPRRLPNPCLDSPQRQDLHRELLFNQRIGKNVLNQKSELEKALSKHKEKQILNQVKEHKETPELERAIAERARRLEQAEQTTVEDEGVNPALLEVRARLRHAAPATPAASAH